MNKISTISLFCLGLIMNHSVLAAEEVTKLADGSAKKIPLNILFIMADDLNDFIGVMNNNTGVKTPNIDKLASKATLFTNAHSNAPICSPSRASLFSGIYPHESGQYAFGNWRQNKVLVNSRTIMEQLSFHGYHSAGTGKLTHQQWTKAWDDFGIRPDYTPLAFDGKKPVGHPDVPYPYNTDVGPLDSTFIPLSKVPHVKARGSKSGHHGWYYGGFKKPFRYVSESDRDPLPDEMYAAWTVNKLAEFEKNKLDKPFFLSVGFIRPHTPLVAPDRFFEMYPLADIKLPDFIEDDDKDTHFESLYAPKTSLGRKHYNTLIASFKTKDEALRKYYQAYLASISFMDEQVGKVLDALNKSRYKDNTLVVFTSDHGYNLGEKNNLFKNNLWQRSTQVPMIIFDPRTNKKQTISTPVSLIDLYPTFTDYANTHGDNRKNDKGLPISGSSLKPLIEGQETPEDTKERYALTVVKLWGDNGLKNFAIRTKDWRYIQYGNDQEELYYNYVDPNETTNLAENKQYAAVKAQLKSKLEQATKSAKK